MKTMQGRFAFACSNRSRTREAPTPTNISTNSDPLMWKNGTPASPATARASSVLPEPGGPTRSTPRGMRAPSAWNLRGFFRNSTTSMSSAFASSTPATSSKVTFWPVSGFRRARLRPNESAWFPVFWVCLTTRSQNPKISTPVISKYTSPLTHISEIEGCWKANLGTCFSTTGAYSFGSGGRVTV
jgi:hypothetical protein